MICYICKRPRGKFNKKNFPVPVAKDVIHRDEEGRVTGKTKELIGHICKVCVKKAVKIQRSVNNAKRRASGINPVSFNIS